MTDSSRQCQPIITNLTIGVVCCFYYQLFRGTKLFS